MELTGVFLLALAWLVLVAAISVYYSPSNNKSERQRYEDAPRRVLISSMSESQERISQFGAALLMYDPEIMKYQDPRRYDFHTYGSASQAWKSTFLKHLREIGEGVVQKALEFQRMIVLFDGPSLVGNVIFVPLEGEFPKTLDDPVMMNKYIRWAPPSNAISAIVPPGYRLRVHFSGGGISDINEGVTPSFVIPQPIEKLVVETKTS